MRAPSSEGRSALGRRRIGRRETSISKSRSLAGREKERRTARTTPSADSTLREVYSRERALLD